MNRYRAGGPSKASSTTLCQKCLKKGHYTYECTAAQQERPYVSRPSRSQQLLNPKLAPKLSAATPPVPDTKASTLALERSQKRESAEPQDSPRAKRRRSSSVSSSDSVSTISTNRSRSRPRSRQGRHKGSEVRARRDMPRSRSRERRRSTVAAERPPHSDRPSSRRQFDNDLDPAERRSRHDSPPRRAQSRTSGRNARGSVDVRQRSRSRSPYRGPDHRTARAPAGDPNPERPARQRSLSPYSRRVALTRDKNGI